MKKIVLGILAHVDSGKTTLSEAMMYRSGNISKFGRVDYGDSSLDTFSLERERGITIFSKQAVLRLGDTVFTLVDTPGHVDFSAETERTLQTLDYAVLVVSGSEGVQSHTQTLWQLLKKYSIPCFVFINKMDLYGAEKEAVMIQLHEKLSDGFVDFTNDSGEDFFENVAMCDEYLLEYYSDNGVIEKDKIIKAIANRKVFPCMFGSALKLSGVDEFLNCIDKYTDMPKYPSEFGAKVFKISQDEQGNRLTFMKITGGRICVKDVLASSKNINNEKINQIRIYSGDKFSRVDEASAGTICAVTGITFACPGDGIGIQAGAPFPVLIPVLTYRVIPLKDVTTHTMLEKLKVLEAEEPQLRVDYSERLKEIHIQLMGEVQLEILRSIIRDRFGIEVGFGEGNIIYKETITDITEGVGHFEPLRHYAEVHLLLKPGKRGSGIVISSQCHEDRLDKNWQRLIMTHLHEKTHLGVLTGSPITDIEIILMSGKAHAKHTEGGDFRQATYRAVRHGLMCANSVLLEPYYRFALEIPTDNVGRAMNDIQLMNGTFDPPVVRGDISVITGEAPVSKMNGYSIEVTSYTHGTGRLICSLKGYEPCRESDKIIESIGYDAEADTENTADSVFCSHGAGHIVKWDEVTQHMHLPSVLSPQTRNDDNIDILFSKCRTQKDVFALDKELVKIFERTYGPVKKRTADGSGKTVVYNGTENYKRKTSHHFDGEEYLLVDGYNVIFAWDELKTMAADNIEAARSTLINILCNYQGYKKCKLILVFDAYKVKGGVGEVECVDGITVVYTKEAETADTYIEKASHKLAKDNRVRVVTSDGMEQLIILGSGALRVSSRAFLQEVRAAEEEIKTIIEGEYS